MKPVEVRKELVDALRLDLIGPCPARNLGTPDEVLPQAPSRWCLTGFLVPLDAGDAHGRGKRQASRVDSRIARLAIHAASTVSVFLIETWQSRTLVSPAPLQPTKAKHDR